MDGGTKKLALRLKKIEGQTAAIRRMVEEQGDCVEALTQIAAAQGALSRVGELILASHIKTCVREAFRRDDPEETRQQVDELMQVFSRYARIGAR